MLSVKEAQAKVFERIRPLAPQSLPLGPAVLGLILAEDVASDLDMPPFDKSMMDGYAVQARDLSSGRRELNVIEEVAAGRMPRLAVGPGQATRIMTGAPLPDGADAVVIVERTTMVDGRTVRIEEEAAHARPKHFAGGREMQLPRRSGLVQRRRGCPRPPGAGALGHRGTNQRARSAGGAGRPVLSTGDEVVERPPNRGRAKSATATVPCSWLRSPGSAACQHTWAWHAIRLDSLGPLVAEGLAVRRPGHFRAACRREEAGPGSWRARRTGRGGNFSQGAPCLAGREARCFSARIAATHPGQEAGLRPSRQSRKRPGLFRAVRAACDCARLMGPELGLQPWCRRRWPRTSPTAPTGRHTIRRS